MDVLAFGLPWENIVVDLVGYLPVQILYGYVMTRLLDIPRPALFVVAYSICSFLVVPFSSLIGMPLFGLMEALLCATPALLARDRALHCVIIVASSIVAVAIAYLAFLLLWMLAADDPFSYQEKYARLAGYAVASGLHLIVLDALFVLLRRAQSRWLTPEVKRYTGEGTKYFIWFPLLQVPFLLIALIGIGTAAAWNPLLVVGVLLMGVFFLVSDLSCSARSTTSCSNSSRLFASRSSNGSSTKNSSCSTTFPPFSRIRRNFAMTCATICRLSRCSRRVVNPTPPASMFAIFLGKSRTWTPEMPR